MNAKLKSILTTAWNEPRAFFLWLTLLCALIFGSIAATAPSRTYLNPLSPAWQMTALLALLGLGVAFVGFVLAWVPPLRRLLAWLLQRRFFVLAALVTLIMLAYAVENWHGHRAWTQFQHEWEAKGERFTLADLMPPAVSDAENFFMAEPWAAVIKTATNSFTGDTIQNAPGILDAFGPRSGQSPGLGDLIKGKRIELQAWQEFYRSTNNSFSAPDGGTTNYFPIAASPQTPAEDVLLALSRYEKTLAQLHAAARRPHARFPVSYQEWATWLPHLVQMKGCAHFLNLHAHAALANGDSVLALQDIQLSFRLGEALNSEPVLITYLVQIAMSQIRLLAIWNGLADHRWTDAQLIALDTALAREDQLKNYLTGMRGERLFGLQSIEQLQLTRDLNSFADSAERSTKQTFWESVLGNSLFRLWPKGWFDQNKLSIAKMHTEFTLPAVDAERHLATPQATRRMAAAVNPPARFLSPYNAFSAMLLPALNRSAEKAARAQSYSDLARVACALERHRLAHGQFPENLAALAPLFIAQLPHDVINGQPLKYRRTDDDSFILYSVGWNETDDGGTVELTKSGGVDPKQGDWVWRYPQP